MINDKISNFILNLDTRSVSEERKKRLNILISHIKFNLIKKTDTKLNFICTHNSRRSQFSQIWSETFAYNFNYENIFSFSGGTEITEVNKGVINVLKKTGFNILQKSKSFNSRYIINFGENNKNINIYSKLYSCDLNPNSEFIAIMNCDDANLNCPFISGASKKVFLPYNDPKHSDNTNSELLYYTKTNIEIATSMKYLYENI